MPQPSNATVSIDGQKFNAVSAHVGMDALHDGYGLPHMGSLRCSISFVVDIHDTQNMPFATLQNLFSLAGVVTRDKIKNIKVEFWQDENQEDAICTYSFQGWISGFHTSGGGGSNHILSIKLQPALDQKQYIDIKMGN
ncbi:hypothetical protein [Edaphobacter modestus]|uniref:Type VI secretion system secreted protein Hcp n=1 Tax=Edaphobacter modestus TaxID=388466 RepID=A0A4Q7XZI7_9BACT|nr:hypothetical protein [Edaphobacter modestus]RZU28963.1 hypothetical protein BDD14_6549 [Edaphobacter modestus]